MSAHAPNASPLDSSSSAATARTAANPAYQAYQILHLAFVVAPIAAGLDKFFHLLVNWDQYLAPVVSRAVGGHGHGFMLVVGVIEIVAGIAVAIKPRYAAYIVAAWLASIVFNLLSYPGFYDVALRDVGLLLGALTLARLAFIYDPPWHRRAEWVTDLPVA